MEPPIRRRRVARPRETVTTEGELRGRRTRSTIRRPFVWSSSCPGSAFRDEQESREVKQPSHQQQVVIAGDEGGIFHATADHRAQQIDRKGFLRVRRAL